MPFELRVETARHPGDVKVELPGLDEAAAREELEKQFPSLRQKYGTRGYIYLDHFIDGKPLEGEWIARKDLSEVK